MVSLSMNDGGGGVVQFGLFRTLRAPDPSLVHAAKPLFLLLTNPRKTHWQSLFAIIIREDETGDCKRCDFDNSNTRRSGRDLCILVGF